MSLALKLPGILEIICRKDAYIRKFMYFYKLKRAYHGKKFAIIL